MKKTKKIPGTGKTTAAGPGKTNRLIPKKKAIAAKDSGKFMVIVESPAKIKTLSRILGPNYLLKACYGHFRDLPPKKLGVNIEKNFRPTYQIIKDREKIVDDLKKSARKAREIFLASDPDREGEAIAWHLREVLEIPAAKIKRIRFNEITEPAVRHAFAHPEEISQPMFEAQQARRFLDRIVGYKLSPLLWKKITRGLSAGRVQSVAVKLVVEREKEIKNFKPQEYWKITAEFTDTVLSSQSPNPPITQPPNHPISFSADLQQLNGYQIGSPADDKTIYRIDSEAEAKKLENHLKQAEFSVIKIETKENTQSPAPPFITSTLQQNSMTQLGFSPKKTMVIAQQLYEGVDLPEGPTALITYMRTDSVRVNEGSIEECRAFIRKHYGTDYLNEETRRFKSRKSAQEAHEAIRPTYLGKTPDNIRSSLTPEQYKLYRLIWNRFVATQMSPARWQNKSVQIEAGLPQPLTIALLRNNNGQPCSESQGALLQGQPVSENIAVSKCTFNAVERNLLFKGFLILSLARPAENSLASSPTSRSGEANPGESEDNGEKLLPPVNEGDKLNLLNIISAQSFTQPPPRYNEASLVKILEKYGIGRPSTYAPIISTIQERGYVSRLGRSRQLQATDLGILVTDKLVRHFQDIMDTNFTARMEEELDEIEESKIKSIDVLKEFYELFAKNLAAASENMTSEKGQESEQKCDKCGKPLVTRWSRYGSFLACSGYPECKNIVGAKKEPPQPAGENCEKCGKPMVIRSGRRGKFIACSGFPKCRNTKSLNKVAPDDDKNATSNETTEPAEKPNNND